MKKPSSTRAAKLRTRATVNSKRNTKLSRPNVQSKANPNNILKDLNLTCIKPLSRAEADKIREEHNREISGLGLIYTYAYVIQEWAECRFKTDDGRVFGLYIDGESIFGRLEVEGVPINRKDRKGIKRVKKIAGFMKELYADDQPFIFDDKFHLAKAWFELHSEYNVELADEEYEALEVMLEPEQYDALVQMFPLGDEAALADSED